MASRAFRRSSISDAMRSIPPMVASSLRVIGEYSDAGPTPIRFECMSLVCRIVKLCAFFCSAGSCPPAVPMTGSSCGSIGLIVIPLHVRGERARAQRVAIPAAGSLSASSRADEGSSAARASVGIWSAPGRGDGSDERGSREDLRKSDVTGRCLLVVIGLCRLRNLHALAWNETPRCYASLRMNSPPAG